MPLHHKSFLDAVMKGLKRQYAKVVEKVDGFTTGQVADMLDFVLRTPTDPSQDSEAVRLRLAALIVVCFFCSARNEEALALRFEDISLKPSGNLGVDFTKGKTNQFKKRFHTVVKDGFILGTELRPVRIVMDYLQLLSQMPGGPPVMLFPQFLSRVVGPGLSRALAIKGDGSTAIAYDYCRGQLKAILDLPDFRIKHALDSGKWGWHSFRGGSLTGQASQGVPAHLMQQQARHANVGTTFGYLDASESEKARASDALLKDMPDPDIPVVPDTTLLQEDVPDREARVDPPTAADAEVEDVVDPPPTFVDPVHVEGECNLDGDGSIAGAPEASLQPAADTVMAGPAEPLHHPEENGNDDLLKSAVDSTLGPSWSTGNNW